MLCGVLGPTAWLASTGDNTKYVAISASTTSGSIHRMNRLSMSLPSFRFIPCDT
jgi:hypothetical protein